MELAADDLKKEGYDLQLIFEDSRSEPARGVGNFNKFLAMDHVNGVIGDIFSFVTEPLIGLSNKRKVLLVSPSTAESLCSSSTGYFFSTATQVSRAPTGYAAFLDLHPEVKKVALVYFQDPGWGYQYRDGWRKLLAERNIEVTGEFESAEMLPDFKTPILKLLQQKPDAFFVAHEPKNFIASARQNAFKGQLVFANNILEVPAGGTVTKDLDGVFFVDTLAKDDFARRFKEKFNEEVLLEPYNGYESLRLFVKAVTANPSNPEQAIPNMKYEGMSGMMDFTGTCSGNRSEWHLKKFEGGKIVLVR